MSELFPIASGLIVGSALPLVRPRMRLGAAAVAAVVLGTLATIVSGEHLIGWEFLLIDIPLVALCAAGSFATTRALRRRIVAARGSA